MWLSEELYIFWVLVLFVGGSVRSVFWDCVWERGYVGYGVWWFLLSLGSLGLCAEVSPGLISCFGGKLYPFCGLCRRLGVVDAEEMWVRPRMCRVGYL